MSVGDINEPASKVNVRRDRRTKMEMQILNQILSLKFYRFSDSLAIQFAHVESGNVGPFRERAICFRITY